MEFYFHSMLLAQSYAHFLHSLKCLLTCYQLPSAFVFDREPQKHLNIMQVREMLSGCYQFILSDFGAIC